MKTDGPRRAGTDDLSWRTLSLLQPEGELKFCNFEVNRSTVREGGLAPPKARCALEVSKSRGHTR